MQPRIIATKLFIPRTRTTEVFRETLVAKLTNGLHRKLTLISAPAGFGKTTLVSQWSQHSEHDFAWLSLDEGDRDPTRFLTYVIAALQRIVPDIGDGLLAALQDPASSERVMAALINNIAANDGHFVLVLDDYHVLDADPIDDLITLLLDHQPPQMHLVITTREDPRLPLARLRARGDLTELRGADLRFASTETLAFLNEHMGLKLMPDEVSILEDRIEGWIAGLQMAALSMQDRSDIGAFLREFTGSHRYIVDYLVEEVLHRQPQPIRQFLLQTAMLDRLNGALCNAVTGREDGQAILEALERSNMLIFPLDDQREWYRYHHLFAEVLRTHALQQYPNDIHNLQYRASVWHEKNGFRSVAIDYAFRAKDMTRAADLIECTWPEGYYGMRPIEWLGWAQHLPDDVVQIRPVLSAAFVWKLLDKGDLGTAEQHLETVEHWLDVLDEDSPNSGAVVANEQQFITLQGSTAAARAYLAQLQGDVAESARHAQRALSHLSPNDHFWQGNAALFLGLAQFALGDLSAAYDAINESINQQRQSQSHYFEILGMTILGDIKHAQGYLQQALGHYEDALSQSSPSGDVTLRQAPLALYAGLSEQYRERNDFKRALHYLEFGLAELERVVLPEGAYRLWTAMARIKASQADYAGAIDALKEAEKVYQPPAIPDVTPITALRARIALQQRQLSDAIQWARGAKVSLEDDPTFLTTFDYATLVRIGIAQYRDDPEAINLAQTHDMLTRLQRLAENSRRLSSAIEVNMLQALAYDAEDDAAAALAKLQTALKLAKPEGYIRIIADEGQPMRQLLSACLANGGDGDYIPQLIAAIDMHSDPTYIMPDANQFLIEPLSDREREVLNLIAEGFTNQDIADALVIALSTVKKHVNNILGKLGVSSRTQAINRARELGIL